CPDTGDRCDGRVQGSTELVVEDGSLGAVRLDPDPSVDPADELPGDVEPEAGAAYAAGHVGIQPVELLEDPFALARRDAETAIGDREADDPLVALEPHVHVAAVRRVLDRVVDQVPDHLTQLSLVRCNGWQPVLDRVELEADA